MAKKKPSKSRRHNRDYSAAAAVVVEAVRPRQSVSTWTNEPITELFRFLNCVSPCTVQIVIFM